MFKLFIFTLRQFLYWTLYFLILQGVFLLFFLDEVEAVSMNHVLMSFSSGFAMNLASAAYFSLTCFLLLFLSVFFPFKAKEVIHVLVICLLILTSLIYFTDMALYQNWGSRINGKALWY